MAQLVLTAIGDDRAGLVTAMSDVVAAHGGNWERSQMAELAGKFAGIVLVTVPEDRVDELVVALAGLKEQGLLDVRADPAGTGASDDLPTVVLDLVGTDRAGIVRDVSRALASSGVSIDELSTTTRDAPMAGGTLFEAHATLHLPPGVSLDDVRRALEAVADELMVDLDLRAD